MRKRPAPGFRMAVPLLVVVGCARATTPPVTVRTDPALGVLPVRVVAILPAETSPLAQNVAANATTVITNLLIEATDDTGWKIISPDRIAGAKLDRSEPLPVRAGKAAALVRADGGLTALVSRYQERVGSDYGVSEPASVALRMIFVPSGRKEVVWQADYAFTQEPLSYNLWNFWGILRGGPKWLTAEELARIGIDEAVSRLHQTLVPYAKP